MKQRKWFILAYSFRGTQSLTMGKGRLQEREGGLAVRKQTDHISSAHRK